MTTPKDPSAGNEVENEVIELIAATNEAGLILVSERVEPMTSSGAPPTGPGDLPSSGTNDEEESDEPGPSE